MPSSMFPTMDSEQDAIQLILSRMSTATEYDMRSMLEMYKNTILAKQAQPT